MRSKKIIKTLAASLLLAPTVSSLSSCFFTYDLVVFNWGEYIDIDALYAFEDTYNVRVKYLTFDSNETMIKKLEGGTRYDVIFPSDYAVEEMAAKDLIEPLSSYDFTYYKEENLVPILKNALDKLKNEGTCTTVNGEYVSCTREDFAADQALTDHKFTAFKEGFDMLKYAVPYTFGQIGILYNKDKISKEEIERDGYDALMRLQNDDGSSRQVVLYDSSKDIVSMAMLATGHDFQYESQKAMDDAESWLTDLFEKKGDNIAIKADEILDDIPNGYYDIAFTFSGDAIYCINATLDDDGNSNWDFYVPEAKGENNNVRTNIYADTMVVMKNSPAKDLAFKFVDFMSSHDVTYLNTVYIGYTATRNDVYEEISNTPEETPCTHHDIDELAEHENHIPGMYNNVPAYRLFAEPEGQLDKFYRYDPEYKQKVEDLYLDIISSIA